MAARHCAAMAETNINPRKLNYRIYYCSSYSTDYCPENILEDKPHDQHSRWAADSNYPPPYLVLKLDSPALLETITFGKFEKAHVCNMKRLKVFVGMTDACSIEVLEEDLCNDNQPETFDVRTTMKGKRIPCLYIKLTPLVGWGPSFSLSVWYVELSGEQDPAIVAPHLKWFREYEEMEVVKLCLKHFRQLGYHSAFKALTDETGVTLEEPCMTELHRLVIGGLYEEAENFMELAGSEGQFSDYLHKQSYRPMWVPIEDSAPQRPGMRGGHQMCVDAKSETVYLLGGWDGRRDMGDFWSYHVPSDKWTQLSNDTARDGGPSPRSCHKMVLDPERRQLFVLGRYVDTQCRAQTSLKSDFFMYDIDANVWTLITDDTAAMGGPQLLFDHQMAFDGLKRILYVFGGRVLTPPPWRAEEGSCPQGMTELKFSGLYSYHVATNTWALVLDDCASWGTPGTKKLMSRVGHSMLFHTGCRKLFIFGGQRCKDFLHDLLTYDVDTGETCTVMEISEKHVDSSIPSSRFTQRATIDPDLNEIYVLSGLSKDKEKRDENAQYSIWVFSITHSRWKCIHKNTNIGDLYWNKMQRLEPCPRFAHQFVYDHINKVHYLFGGNPGRVYLPKLRLDDFWKLHLKHPSERHLMRRLKFLIRKHRFEELALNDRLSALQYLQTSVYEIIDHDDLEQTKEFQQLTPLLFQAVDLARYVPRPIDSIRNSLYNQLVEFLPDDKVQPRGNLLDAIPLFTTSISD